MMIYGVHGVPAGPDASGNGRLLFVMFGANTSIYQLE